MFTQSELETKSGPELVAIFNALDGVDQVKRFRNRETGVKRILAFATSGYAEEGDLFRSGDPKNPAPPTLINMLNGGEPTETSRVDASQPNESNAPKTREPKVRGIYNLERKELIRTFRPNSRRGRLITLLLNEGSTFDALLANTEVGFNEEGVLHKTLRILNWWTGYGLTTDADGVIRLTD